MSVQISYIGLEAYKAYAEAAPQAATVSARIAINFAVQKGYKTSIPRELLKQVAFPAGYLDLPNRLEIDKPASDDNLASSILARDKPTSLARFVLSGIASFKSGKKGTETNLPVMVKPGQPKTLKRVFPIKLRRGNQDVDPDSFNVGLAIRLKPGETLHNRSQGNAGIEINSIPDVYLLYGPSVQQAFIGAVDAGALEEVTDALESEFYRQFALRVDGTV